MTPPRDPTGQEPPGHAGSSQEAAAPRLLRGRVRTPGGRTFDVEVVQDDLSRQRGLQQRAHLAESSGMLFVFPRADLHRFWMYKCLIPLDIIWIDASRTVVHLETALPVCRSLPCPDYGPGSASLYVLELGAGVAAKAAIRPGVKLEIVFADPPRPS